MVYNTLLLAALITSQSDAIPAVETLEQQVLAQRRSMQKGKVVLRSRIYEGQATNPWRDCEYTVWFDGKKNRTEIKATVDPNKAAGSRWVYGRDFAEGEFVFYTDEQHKTGSPVVEISSRDPQSQFQAVMNPDPRMLGMHPVSFAHLARYNLESLLARKDRGMPKVERTYWKSQEGWRIDFTERRSIDCRVWVVPSWGYSIVRVEAEYRDGGKHYLQTVESDVQPYRKSKLWYPRSCVSEKRIDGKLTTREVVEVTSVSLNEDLPANTFSLAGLGLPIGKAIVGLSPKGTLFWDGTKAVPRKGPPPRQPQPQPQSQPMTSTRTWLLLASGAFAVIAVAITWWFLLSNKWANTQLEG